MSQEQNIRPKLSVYIIAYNEADKIALTHRARFASAEELFDDLEKNSRK